MCGMEREPCKPAVGRKVSQLLLPLLGSSRKGGPCTYMHGAQAVLISLSEDAKRKRILVKLPSLSQHTAVYIKQSRQHLRMLQSTSPYHASRTRISKSSHPSLRCSRQSACISQLCTFRSAKSQATAGPLDTSLKKA